MPGNHDLAAIGLLPTDDFNRDAAAAAPGRPASSPPKSGSTWRTCPTSFSQGDFTLVHGTLRWPIWEYLDSPEAALAHLQRQQTPFSLVGHTHVPMLVVEDEQDSPEGCQMHYLEDGTTVELA